MPLATSDLRHPPGTQSAKRTPLAIVTGAASGLGLELARCCAIEGYDLIITADDDPAFAVQMLSDLGAAVQTVEGDDPATPDVAERVLGCIGQRQVDAFIVNTGQGLETESFLEQDFDDVLEALDSSITNTLYLVQAVGRGMAAVRAGHLLVVSAIPGFTPGRFQPVHNASRAFINAFCWALRNELEPTGVSLTCLLLRFTDTHFLPRAVDLEDTMAGSWRKTVDPGEVARIGFRAMLHGDRDVVAELNRRRPAAGQALAVPELRRTFAEPWPAS